MNRIKSGELQSNHSQIGRLEKFLETNEAGVFADGELKCEMVGLGYQRNVSRVELW
jgi:hypothetical protein